MDLKDREIYLRVRKHLLSQGTVSKDSIFKCAYRGEGNLKCAIGVLIADEHYHRDLEGSNVESDNVRWALERSGVEFGPGTEEMFVSLQEIHDAYEPKKWEQLMDERFGRVNE